MSYTIIKKLPPIESVIADFPVSATAEKRIAQDRLEVKSILDGTDKRLLIIVGPCSAWPKEAVLNYAQKLTRLNQRVGHALKLVMRVYIQKPRTTKGWLGPINQPDLFADPDIEVGMRYTREMMVKVVELGLAIADEALFIHNAKGFLELLSWVAIGARSSEDQEHRIFASSLDCAVGLKNATHGSLKVAVNGVVAAQHSHVAVFDGYEVQTHGNPYAHLVLRGANGAPNYSIAHLEEINQYIKAHALKNPSVIIDVSHDNCLVNGKKDHRLQPKTVLEVMETLKDRPDLKSLVKGFMIESFIKEGTQTVSLDKPDSMDLSGLSITDPCLSFEETETLLLQLAEVHDVKSY